MRSLLRFNKTSLKTRPEGKSVHQVVRQGWFFYSHAQKLNPLSISIPPRSDTPDPEVEQ
jgi:hypothetical protein